MGKIRDITFDIAKGIGIVLVVIGHYIPDNAPSWYRSAKIPLFPNKQTT